VRSTSSILLSLLLLAGSVSVAVNRHFCGGELQSVAWFAEAEVCHAEVTEKAPCPFHSADSDTNNCCDDEHELVELDDDRQTVDAPGLPQFTLALLPPPPVFRSALHLRPRPNTNFQYYRPPPLVTDVAREWQVFRL
jgi:hypothetical protein